jgi:hypothetical protein
MCKNYFLKTLDSYSNSLINNCLKHSTMEATEHHSDTEL